MDISTAIGSILEAGRRLGDRGLISAGEGNLSIRLGPDRLLVTPTGRRKDELGADDLITIRLDRPDADPRSATGLRPSSDLLIHVAVHAARPDLGAVVHAHLPAAMALTLAGEVPDPSVLPEMAVLLPRLPTLASQAPGSKGLAEAIAAAISAPPEPPPGAVLVERHGAYAVGSGAAAAVDRLELIEVLCRAWRDALLIRAARQSVGIVGEPSPGSAMEGT
jgi:L-fuculose-phosphate aldolase